jgi:hypothetical protein
MMELERAMGDFIPAIVGVLAANLPNIAARGVALIGTFASELSSQAVVDMAIALTLGFGVRDLTHRERERFGELFVQMLGAQPEAAGLLREQHPELVDRLLALDFQTLADLSNVNTAGGALLTAMLYEGLEDDEPLEEGWIA